MSTLRKKVENIYDYRITAKSKKTTNSNARFLADDKLPFIGSNMYAEWRYPESEEEPPMYVVYSYGEHYPMLIWEPISREWLINTTVTTPTTNKHKNDVHPNLNACETRFLPLDTDTMIDIINRGIRIVYQEILENEVFA